MVICDKLRSGIEFSLKRQIDTLMPCVLSGVTSQKNIVNKSIKYSWKQFEKVFVKYCFITTIYINIKLKYSN